MTDPQYSHPTEIVTTGQLERHAGPVDRVPEYDPATREHLWITLVMYRVDPARVEAGEQLILDSVNLLSAGLSVGCFYCESPYAKRLTYRPCPGEPSP